MQYKMFKIPCLGDKDAEESMNRFLRSHRVVSVTKEPVTPAAGPYLVLSRRVSSERGESGKSRFSR